MHECLARSGNIEERVALRRLLAEAAADQPGGPVSFAADLRHDRGAALVTAHRDRDVAIVKGIERRDRTLARNAERAARRG